jgi:uncharacterized membrane protein|tara:strand:+ start:475 stop:822 length:348 start_codon:yes stop_codon:yes gene_type:complete
MKSCIRSLGTECINSLIKATIWRFIATGISFLILFSFGLGYNKSLLLALLDTCIKFFTFYLFDLCWVYIYDPIKNKYCQKRIHDEEDMAEVEVNNPTLTNNSIITDEPNPENNEV